MVRGLLVHPRRIDRLLVHLDGLVEMLQDAKLIADSAQRVAQREGLHGATDLRSFAIRRKRSFAVAALRTNDRQAVQRVGDGGVRAAVHLAIEGQRGDKSGLGKLEPALRVAKHPLAEEGARAALRRFVKLRLIVKGAQQRLGLGELPRANGCARRFVQCLFLSHRSQRQESLDPRRKASRRPRARVARLVDSCRSPSAPPWSRRAPSSCPSSSPRAWHRAPRRVVHQPPRLRGRIWCRSPAPRMASMACAGMARPWSSLRRATRVSPLRCVRASSRNARPARPGHHALVDPRCPRRPVAFPLRPASELGCRPPSDC